MKMQIDERDGCCRLHLAGEMIDGAIPPMRGEILPLVSRSVNIEVDLSGVSGIDSSGLELMLLLKRMAGGRLNFTGHSQAVLQMLDAAAVACSPAARMASSGIA